MGTPTRGDAGTSTSGGGAGFSTSGGGGLGTSEGGNGSSSGVLIYGDSMVRFSAQVNKETGAEVNFYPGIRTEQLENVISRQRKDENKKVVLILVGTNDIKRRGSMDYIVGEMYDLVRRTKEKYRNAAIVISGVIRRRDVNFKKVYGLNNEIDWVCQALNCTFVDPNSWIEDRDIGRDGLHLNRRGARKLGELHQWVIDSCRRGKELRG